MSSRSTRVAATFSDFLQLSSNTSSAFTACLLLCTFLWLPSEIQLCLCLSTEFVSYTSFQSSIYLLSAICVYLLIYWKHRSISVFKKECYNLSHIMLVVSSKNNTKGHSLPSCYIPKTVIQHFCIKRIRYISDQIGIISNKNCTTFLDQALSQEYLLYLLYHLLFFHLLIYISNIDFINTYVEGTF